MQTPPDWAAYASRARVLENRRQSSAYLNGLRLKPQALHAPGNHIDKTPRDFADWLYPETFQNWGCPLVGDFGDCDTDIKTKSDTPESYDQGYRDKATIICQHVYDALLAAGVKVRAFGRASLNGRGHFIVEVPVSKGEEDLLRRLHMRRAVEHDGLMVRIEFRRRPEKKESPKNFTLPGSVYRMKDGTGYDLIRWAHEDEWNADAVMPPLEPQPYDKLRLAMYMALMGLALLPMWERDNRHHCAFYLAGALAHECREGSFSEDECKAIMQFMIDQSGDDDAKDRMRCLDDAFTAMGNGRKVTGYTAMVKEGFISEEWKQAILRLRGGGDPDAVGRLFDIVARVEKGVKKANTYVDLSAGAERYVEMEDKGLRVRFRNRPEFPAVPNRQGKLVPAIEVVMHSDRIKTYAQAVSFPGIPFNTIYTYDHVIQEFSEVGPDETPPVGEPLFLNVAAGFVTKPYDEGDAPDPHVYSEALAHWRLLQGHLTASDPRQVDDLEQIIAWKLQHVREKQQVGCALVGGTKIGKTFLFDTVLAALIGDELIKKSSTQELESQYRFMGIERVLFYVVEECRFDKLDVSVLQMIKDVMRNRRIHRNAKWGDVGDVGQVAAPFFLSNDLNPRLVFDGVPDRALVIIRGEHQASLGMTKDEWEAHQAAIHVELVAFAEALKREDIRRALLHHFLEVKLREDIFSKNENRVDAVDVEESQSPIQAAILAILREGYIMPLRPGLRGPSIRDPFPLETLAAGLRERLRDQRVSTFDTAPSRAALAVADLFKENTRERGNPKSKGVARAKRDKILKLVRYYDRDVDKGMYYFGLRRGSLLALLEEVSGIKLEPDYTLDADGEKGEAPVPEKADLAKWYRYAAEQAQSGSFSRFGVI